MAELGDCRHVDRRVQGAVASTRQTVHGPTARGEFDRCCSGVGSEVITVAEPTDVTDVADQHGCDDRHLLDDLAEHDVGHPALRPVPPPRRRRPVRTASTAVLDSWRGVIRSALARSGRKPSIPASRSMVPSSASWGTTTATNVFVSPRCPITNATASRRTIRYRRLAAARYVLPRGHRHAQ